MSELKAGTYCPQCQRFHGSLTACHGLPSANNSNFTLPPSAEQTSGKREATKEHRDLAREWLQTHFPAGNPGFWNWQTVDSLSLLVAEPSIGALAEQIRELKQMFERFAYAEDGGLAGVQRALLEAIQLGQKGPTQPCFTCEGEQGLPATKAVYICSACAGDDPAKPQPSGKRAKGRR